jgi:anthranilate synthase/aminodeoxychorismate synthase-like glutamine amidotransferase
MILLIDNYDSFVHNLARYFNRLGHETETYRNDAITVTELLRRRPQAVVLSPGPSAPEHAGVSLEAARRCPGAVPLLGICLGHQALGAAWGAKIVRARQPRHGRSSAVTHDGTGLFAGLDSPTTVGRYHSLAVDRTTLPDCFRPTAFADDGELMAIEHRETLAFGVQFHPESILTTSGYALLANFLRLAGLATPADPTALTRGESCVTPPPVAAASTPIVTF